MAFFEFFLRAGALKRLPRTGWVRHGVKDPETVAGHVMRLALLCRLCAPKAGVDTARCVELALVHDLPEAVCGDLVVHGAFPDAVTRVEKARRERRAMEKLASLLPAGEQRALLDAFKEFEDARTPEARLVRDLDVVEMVMQALEYAREKNFARSLDAFFEVPRARLSTPLGRRLFDQTARAYRALARRNARTKPSDRHRT